MASLPQPDCQRLLPRVEVRLECDDGRIVLSDWHVALLEAVEAQGSLVAAARSLGIPHRTAWQRVHQMEICLGTRLLETNSGGRAGGGSRLSGPTLDLIHRYRTVTEGLDRLVLQRFNAVF